MNHLLENFKALQGAIKRGEKISHLVVVHSVGIRSDRSFFAIKEARLKGRVLSLLVFLKEKDKKKGEISVLEFRDWETVSFTVSA